MSSELKKQLEEWLLSTPLSKVIKDLAEDAEVEGAFIRIRLPVFGSVGYYTSQLTCLKPEAHDSYYGKAVDVSHLMTLDAAPCKLVVLDCGRLLLWSPVKAILPQIVEDVIEWRLFTATHNAICRILERMRNNRMAYDRVIVQVRGDRLFLRNHD